jgi:hypothetical protein
MLPFAGGWERHQDRHCIWIVTPPGYDHHHAFDEVAEGLSEAFSELGGSAPITREPASWNGRSPIVLGPNLLPTIGNPSLPEDSILYNLEQFSVAQDWFGGEYMALLRRYPVLDYHRRNQLELQRAGIVHAGVLEIGYSPSLTRIPSGLPKDIDVLFYGALTERRIGILDELRSRGLEVVSLFGVYGTTRDEFIARAKIVLNMHQYAPNIFELVRVNYLLANRVCVVSEGQPDDQDLDWLRGGLEVVPYDLLVSRCVDLAQDPNRRKQLGNTGYERIRSRPQSHALMRCMLDYGSAFRAEEGRESTIRGVSFGDELVIVDNMHFVNCTFERTALSYSGGGVPGFDDCSLKDVNFQFEGAASNAVDFLRMLIARRIIPGI